MREEVALKINLPESRVQVILTFIRVKKKPKHHFNVIVVTELTLRSIALDTNTKNVCLLTFEIRIGQSITFFIYSLGNIR